MDVDHVVQSFLSYKKQQYGHKQRAARLDVLGKQSKSWSLPVLHAKPTADFGYSQVARNESSYVLPKRRRLPVRRRIALLFGRDPEAAIDLLLSCLFNHLVTRRCRARYSKKVVKLCAFVLCFIRDLQCEGGIKVKRRSGRRLTTRVSKVGRGYYVSPRDIVNYSHDAKRCVTSVIRCCIYLKSALAGFRISYKVIFSLVKQVSQCVSRKLDDREEKWIDLDIKKDDSVYDIVEDGANFIANVLCHQMLPLHLVLRTTLSQWRSFRHNYVKQMFHVLVLLEYFVVDWKISEVVYGFKAALNTNLNTQLFFAMHPPPSLVGGGGTATAAAGHVPQMSRTLCHLYGLLNRKALFHQLNSRFGLHRYNLEKIIAQGVAGKNDRRTTGSHISHVRWIITVVTLLLQSSTDVKRNTWFAIQIMAGFFHDGGVRCGLLRCQCSKACFRCLILYTEIFRGLYGILTRLREVDVYPYHVNLVKILLKNDISKICATFGDLDKWAKEDLSREGERRKKGTCRIKGNTHSTPSKVWYAAQLIRQVCLTHSSRKGIDIKQKHYRIDVAFPFPVYLKLLFAIQNNVSGVKVLHNVDKVMKSRHCYTLLDQLVPLHVRESRPGYELRNTNSGKLPFQGFMAVVAQIYLFNKGVDDCLSDLVVQNQLNVMQRTQACHVLANSPHVIALALPQLVQSLAVDPGNRVWHLLSLALRRHQYVRERAPYFTACMIHSSEGTMHTLKAKQFLELILKTIGGPAQLDGEIRNLHMHSQLLNLTSNLVNVDSDRRREALQQGIRLINQSVVEAGVVKLFDDSIESAKSTFNQLGRRTPLHQKVVAMDPETAKVLQSATRAPFMLDFRLEHNRCARYLYKMNDDMRQDALVVQIMVFMLHVFRTYNLEAYLHPFLVVPYSTTLPAMVDKTSAVIELLVHQEVAPSESICECDKVTEGSGTHPPSYVEDHVVDDKRRAKSEKISWYNRPKFWIHNKRWSDPQHQRLTMKDHMNNLVECITCHSKRNHGSPQGDKSSPTVTQLLGGIVGFIPGTISRHAIGKEYNVSLEDYFVLKFGPRGSYKFNRAMDNFINSLAGYSLLCFLLQIKDRHNGNLLISPEGHIIHIDFGFILGASPAADVTFEHAPFKLTREMIDLLGGVDSDDFHRYVRLLVAAYLAVRQEADIFIAMVKLLEHSGMASFRRNSVLKLRQRFYLNTTPERAANYMIRRIHIAIHSKTTMLYDIVQGWQQGIQH